MKLHIATHVTVPNGHVTVTYIAAQGISRCDVTCPDSYNLCGDFLPPSWFKAQPRKNLFGMQSRR